jgi:hypothetical protein
MDAFDNSINFNRTTGSIKLQDAKIVINDQFTPFAVFQPDRNLSSPTLIHIHCGIAKKIVFFGTFWNVKLRKDYLKA